MEAVRAALVDLVSELRKYHVAASLRYLARKIAEKTGVDERVVSELLRRREVYGAVGRLYGNYLLFYDSLEDVVESPCLCVVR
jgi:hypothetical protein